MKKWLNIFFIVFFILCLGVLIGTFSVIVKCCSGNSELMFDGILDNTKIKIEKDLGNATMASYMTVYVDGQEVYNEKCYLRDTVENVIWHNPKGVLHIILRETTEYDTYRDTITITLKGTEEQISSKGEQVQPSSDNS